MLWQKQPFFVLVLLTANQQDLCYIFFHLKSGHQVILGAFSKLPLFLQISMNKKVHLHVPNSPSGSRASPGQVSYQPLPTYSPCQPSILPGVWFPVVIWTLRGTATRAVITFSTCCSWVCLVGPCCYGCTWLQLKKFTHEETNFYWCEDYGYKLIKTRWQPWYSNIP